ncbi:hypothetical protein GCM10009765_48960 [Fodinicola feengrottensis]|uniref:Uncharacterized protein n=1 Tax=Fodinicola feengrottensis TaxID=435914 RepID=A0ABN2HUR3_9ACTN
MHAVRSLSHDLDVGRGVQDGSQPGAYDGLVVGHHNTHDLLLGPGPPSAQILAQRMARLTEVGRAIRTC